MPVATRAASHIPPTLRVLSPSPTPPDITDTASSHSNYNGPITRSKQRSALRPSAVSENDYSGTDSADKSPLVNGNDRWARTRSCSHKHSLDSQSTAALQPSSQQSTSLTNPLTNGAHATSDHLALLSPAPSKIGRAVDRSPSPLGIIPVHRRWRSFVHKHEVPRKVLHVSIGFVSLWLYVSGTQTMAVTPWLMRALIPIVTVDYLRHHNPTFNRLYVRVLGALMRESEFAGWNGVIFYLLGAWIVLYAFPKDVGLMGVLLLSWCDTAASTFGRLYGRYTPAIRRGKSLAGSFAAFIVGVMTSAFFWGWLAPRVGPFPGDEDAPFMFTGTLTLPSVVSDSLSLDTVQGSITGPIALGIMSLWSGLIAATSEVVNFFGWDDNLTIPVLSGLGIWGFLKVFG